MSRYLVSEWMSVLYACMCTIYATLSHCVLFNWLNLKLVTNTYWLRADDVKYNLCWKSFNSSNVIDAENALTDALRQQLLLPLLLLLHTNITIATTTSRKVTNSSSIIYYEHTYDIDSTIIAHIRLLNESWHGKNYMFSCWIIWSEAYISCVFFSHSMFSLIVWLISWN